jgi:hypothetical protein
MVQGDEFVYKDLWSSRTTWAGEPPPFEGESVIIPVGQHILYDLPSSPELSLILVEGTLLPNWKLHLSFAHLSVQMSEPASVTPHQRSHTRLY